MHQRRSSVHVMADILRLGEAGATEIMYSANMSYRQLCKYLDFLVRRGFLERTVVPNPGVKYRVTEKGDRLLQSIENVLGMLELPEAATPSGSASLFDIHSPGISPGSLQPRF